MQTTSLDTATRRFQRKHIAGQIKQAGGNMTIAAERLGIDRANLYRKMRQLRMGAAHVARGDHCAESEPPTASIGDATSLTGP
jgi:DNA-binding NtrC family response regulator